MTIGIEEIISKSFDQIVPIGSHILRIKSFWMVRSTYDVSLGQILCLRF